MLNKGLAGSKGSESEAYRGLEIYIYIYISGMPVLYNIKDL